MTGNNAISKVTFFGYNFTLHFDDGRRLDVPLRWFPKLVAASAPELRRYELTEDGGIHWESLDEDILVENLLKGIGSNNENTTVS